MARLPGESIQFPLRHPAGIAASPVAERWEDSHIFGSRGSLAQRVRNRLASVGRVGAGAGAILQGKSDHP
jgi:hypothetical protein